MHTPVFKPNVNISYQFFEKASLGLEYYGGMGYITHLDPLKIKVMPSMPYMI